MLIVKLFAERDCTRICRKGLYAYFKWLPPMQRFTKVLIKPLSGQYYGKYCSFSRFKSVTSDNFYVALQLKCTSHICKKKVCF